MKLEELRAEADKHGYMLTKKRKYVKLKPCVCGCNRHSIWFIDSHNYQYRCNQCGFKGDIGSTKYAARIAWNKAVEMVSK